MRMHLTGINTLQTSKGRTIAKMKKIILIMSLIIINIASAAVPTIDWYDVEDWELQVCDKWGGVEELNDGTTSAKIYLSQMVITLQAEKVVFQLDETDYTTQYKIGWYFAPYQDDYIYSVHLEGDSQIWLVDEESADQASGKSGFKAFYENETVYHEAILDYCTTDFSDCGSLTVPVVE